jgi:ATP-dependent Clp protease ATP-binding subunit ClpA
MDDQNRFDKFTERARKVLSLAQEEAQRFQHNYIGTEHLLLGLVREGEGVAAEALQFFNVDLEKVRSSVEFIIGRGGRIVLGEIGLTPRAKEVIELAIDEARRLNHHYIGTEHLLLGIVREGGGIAVGVLESLGVNLENLRTRIIQMLGLAPGTTISSSQANPRPTNAPSRNRFDKFTARARKVLSLAQEEAQRFQHNYIGTEHLLLGLVREGQGVAARVLQNLGVDLPEVRNSVENIIGRGDRIVRGEIGLTPRAKKVIELSVDEARRLNHHYIGTEHMLLGLVREGEGIAAGVLESLGVTLERVRRETITVLGRSNDQPAPAPAEAEPESVDVADQPAAITLQPLQDEDDRLPTTPQEQDRFDKFSVRARRVMESAQQEAEHLQHYYIGTEHILLGLIREKRGIAAQVLLNLGVETAKVRSAVEFISSGNRAAPTVPPDPGPFELTPRARRVIELAVDEAHRLNHAFIGTEHLLLGLIREGEGIAAGVLESLGVTLEKARKQTIRLLGHE